MTTDLIARLRLMHKPRTERPGSCCIQCGIVWPCPTSKVLDEARQPEAEIRPQRVQCGDCGAVGPVVTEGGLAYLDPSGQIGHHAQPGTGGVCVFGTGRPQAEGAQR